MADDAPQYDIPGSAVVVPLEEDEIAKRYGTTRASYLVGMLFEDTDVIPMHWGRLPDGLRTPVISHAGRWPDGRAAPGVKWGLSKTEKKQAKVKSSVARERGKKKAEAAQSKGVEVDELDPESTLKALIKADAATHELESVWDGLKEKAKGGDYRSIELYLNYTIGKPTQRTDHKHVHELELSQDAREHLDLLGGRMQPVKPVATQLPTGDLVVDA